MQRAGFIHGTGAALNVELGWIPDYVRIVNITDGDKIYENWLGTVIAFTSGSSEIKGGDKITGLTNTGVYATIREVILDSGSWAGGDAAGWFICDTADVVGTFGSEGVELNNGGTDVATVSAQTFAGVDIDTEVAGTSTAATQIRGYAGDADNGYKPGFTVGSTVSENAKLLGYLAIRNDYGEGQGPRVLGNLQGEAVW